MSDSEEERYNRDYNEVAEEIKICKSNPQTASMFVSGWDDADQDVQLVKDPKANPVDHVLWAAEHNELGVLKEILTTQPDLVHSVDDDGYTPLHRAAYSNHVAVISYLLSVGASVKKATKMGWTPLHSACNWNNYSAVARLLAAGADPSALSEGEQTPLHLASAMSHCKSTLLILLLRDDMVDVVKKHSKSDETPEQLARSYGIYAPLFEMASPASSYIRSLQYTCNPYLRDGLV